MKEEHVTNINRSTYLQALGLFTLAQANMKKAREAEAELAKLLGYKDDYLNNISDHIWEGTGLDKALEKEGIKVNGIKALRKS